MIVLILSFLFLAAEGRAQTTVYLRGSGPAGVTVSGATNSTPVVIQTATPHNLAAGDTVSVWGVCGTTTANGIRKVKAVVDSTHFSITDLNGADVAGNAAWCNGSTASAVGAPQGAGKVTSYSLTDHPRVFLDGPAGKLTREVALGTHNGLVSLVVAGNLATVTTDYEHGVVAGDKVGIWGTTSAGLNGSGAARTITAVTATTFSFPIILADGDYTTNNACGPGGTDNCVRVSQRAWSGNPWWDAMLTKVTNNWSSGVSYKHLFDGGTQSGETNMPIQWATAGMKLFVDPTDTQMRNIVVYALTHIERIAGVNFTANEAVRHGGNNGIADFGSFALWGIAALWETGKDYLTPSEQQTFLDKIFNDVDDPSLPPCKRNIPLNNEGKLLASGTAQGGGSNTITLAPADLAANNYYINNIVMTTINGTSYYGLITAYNASTKVATISGNWTVNPSLGTAYRIYATITRDGTTITGYNTTFTNDLEVGDAVIGTNAWNPSTPHAVQSYVSAINSDTSLTVINSNTPSANATPSILWQLGQWKPGSCGLFWLQEHWEGAYGPQPPMYPPTGGMQAGWGTSALRNPAWGSNNGATYSMGGIAAGLAMADTDPRVVRKLAMRQSAWFDYHLRFAMQYDTGFTISGSYYSWSRPLRNIPHTVQAIFNSVPSYPAVDPAGPWITSMALMKMYDSYPDLRAVSSIRTIWPARFGTDTAANSATAGSIVASGHIIDGGFIFAPSVMGSKYLKQFLTDRGLWASTAVLSTDALNAFVSISPRQQAADYTAQPTQYLFQGTSQSACDSLTGWTCTGTLRGDGLISRTGWNSQTDTHVMFQARTYWADHDVAAGGSLRVYKAGHLLNTDELPHGTGGGDGTKVDNMMEFGGATNLKRGQADGLAGAVTSNIIRWAAGNHGPWDTAYGDASSRYVYALADLAGQYTVNVARAYRHLIHFKKPGTEEIIIQFDDAVPGSAIPIRSQVHYAQNGETNDGMLEGNTTCPGVGGCADLNTSRLILSQESGTRESATDPLRNFGIISRFFSPGSIFVRGDGSTYSGAAGHTYRVSICAGTSCNTPADKLEAVIVHKIANSLDDTTLTAKALNTDAGWTGVQTADKVALFARNNVPRLLASFQTDHDGVAQYLIAGLQDGLTYRTYRVNDGTDLPQQPVLAADNTLYFEAPAGNYLVFPVGLSNLILGAVSMPEIRAGASFQYDFKVTGDTAAYVWSISAGRLPAGLTLSSNGMLAGTPIASGRYPVTIQALRGTAPATFALTLVVRPKQSPRLAITSAVSSGAILAYGLPGMNAAQPCSISISDQPDFSTLLERLQDDGGPARRVYVAGSSTPLRPGAAYYIKADCSSFSETAEFITSPAKPVVSRIISIPISLPPAWNGSAVEIQYGDTPQLGSSTTVPCAGTCIASFPVMSDRIYYLRRIYRDASAQVVAQSSIQPMAVD